MQVAEYSMLKGKINLETRYGNNNDNGSDSNNNKNNNNNNYDFGKTEVNLKYGDKEKIKEEVIKMNKVLQHVKITGFTHCRNVMQAAMRIVGEEVGMKKSNAKKKKEPFCKRRSLRDISRLRKDLSRIEAWFARRRKKDKNKEKDLLDQKYGL